MGCGASAQNIGRPSSLASKAADDKDKETTDHPVVFKVLPSEKEARTRFEDDGTLTKNSDAGHLALRTMLDEPLSQNALGKFASKIQVLDVFMCWIDTQEYKAIPAGSYRRSKALHIFSKYLSDDAVQLVGGISPQERLRVQTDLDRAKDDLNILTNTFYDSVQTKCFLDMYSNIFLPFKQTQEFQQLTAQLRNKYNAVRISDFDYYNKLGEGGFGFVVHCRKKSTGKHYAMKIQTKVGMLDCYRDDPFKANLEKEAFAALQHPFIVNLFYAFQTPTLTLMVLGLADAGDMHMALTHAPQQRLPEDRVRFYIAEMICALDYLHTRGLIYRDLKPQNVLLNSDGHIQLVDLGGVMDEHGQWSKRNTTSETLLPLFAAPADTLGTEAVQTAEHRVKNPKRKQSIMGTVGYMAPEMVILLNKPAKYGEPERHATKLQIKKGYTSAVDWWSLGVVMFKLLTGSRPFADKNVQAFVQMATQVQEVIEENIHFREYAQLFQKLTYPNHISLFAQDLMTKLMDVDDKTRLGANSVMEIKKHSFFDGLDWLLLEAKQIEPPYRPPKIDFEDGFVPMGDLKSLLSEHGKEYFFDENPREEEQRYFESWDFISPHTLRVEAGLSSMMEVLVTNVKARQVLGSDDVQARKPEKSEKSASTKFFGR